MIGLVEKVGALFFAKKGEKLPSNEKLELAKETLKDMILSSELIVGKDIIDEEKFVEGLEEMINGGVKAMNACGWKK